MVQCVTLLGKPVGSVYKRFQQRQDPFISAFVLYPDVHLIYQPNVL